MLRLGRGSIDEELISHTRGAVTAAGGTHRPRAVCARADGGAACGGVGDGRGGRPWCGARLGVSRAEAEGVAARESGGVGGEAEVHL
eukprot:scaffold121081_cov45-Phaeocystis_antarctica.AAC.1